MNWPISPNSQRELFRSQLEAGGAVVVNVMGRPRLSEALDMLELLVKNKRLELERNGFVSKVQT